MKSRFVLTGRARSAPLPFVPALVELRLPYGFHDLSPDEKKRALEEAMASAFEQGLRAISERITAAVA